MFFFPTKFCKYPSSGSAVQAVQADYVFPYIPEETHIFILNVSLASRSAQLLDIQNTFDVLFGFFLH